MHFVATKSTNILQQAHMVTHRTEEHKNQPANTVKITYNEHGYCEFTFITKFF